jgi:hypothetical protein
MMLLYTINKKILGKNRVLFGKKLMFGLLAHVQWWTSFIPVSDVQPGKQVESEWHASVGYAKSLSAIWICIYGVSRQTEILTFLFRLLPNTGDGELTKDKDNLDCKGYRKIQVQGLIG